MKKKDSKTLCEGKERKSASEWLEDINEYPEKFGTSKEHIRAVDKKIRQLEEQANRIPRHRKRKLDEDEIVEAKSAEEDEIEKTERDIEEAALATKEAWW